MLLKTHGMFTKSGEVGIKSINIFGVAGFIVELF